jgi:hypothetical protein
MNETYALLNHGLALNEDKHMLCIINTEFRVHMAVSLVIAITFLQFYIIIGFLCIFIFIRNPPWYFSIRAILVNNLSWMFEERYSSLLRLSIVEMILTLIYMFFAFMFMQFGLSNPDHGVTSRDLTHWFVEASPYMVIFFAVFCQYCDEWDDDVSNNYPIFAILGILMKIPVFVLMRYAERESDSFINEFKFSVFDIFCHLTRK